MARQAERVVSGCASPVDGHGRSDAGLRWAITRSALDAIRSQDGGAALADAFFNNPRAVDGVH